jgi:hypothetical protein
LIQQLCAMHQDARAVAFLGGRLGDVAENTGLAASGAEHTKNRPLTHLVLKADVIHHLLLVGA